MLMCSFSSFFLSFCEKQTLNVRDDENRLFRLAAAAPANQRLVSREKEFLTRGKRKAGFRLFVTVLKSFFLVPILDLLGPWKHDYD